MLLRESVEAVRQSVFSRNFVKPLYGTFCFSGIPSSVQSLLGLEPHNWQRYCNGTCCGACCGACDCSWTVALPTSVFPVPGNTYKKVIFVLVDALGWRFLENHLLDHPFVKRFMESGVVSKLTSQFPSTTVVHSLTMSTGLLPAQTGILEWFYYEPVIGDVICPLLYRIAGDKSKCSLKNMNSQTHAIFPNKSFCAELKDMGVQSYVYQHKAYTPSPFSDATMFGAEFVPFSKPSDAVVCLMERMSRDERAYHYLYLDSVDHVSHEFGPSSAKSINEAQKMLTFLESSFFGKATAQWQDTLLIVTADHGQTDTDLRKVVYINREWPEIESKLKKATRTGKPIVPCGGMGRNLFLHVQPQFLNETREKLAQILCGRAEVYSVQKLVEAGIFGTHFPAAAFFERAGDLIVLPYAGESVWWFEANKHMVKTLGNHGGLSCEEMEIPFLTLAYN